VYLPQDKVIDLTIIPPRLGDLPPDTKPLPKAKPKTRCSSCGDYYIDLKKHTICRGAVATEPEQRRIILPEEAKVKEYDYSRLIYWVEPLMVKVGNQKREFESWDELVDYFLTLEDGRIMVIELDWLEELTPHLNAREITPKVFKQLYQVETKFHCRLLSLYSLERLEDVEPISRYLYQLTGQNLVEHWTLPAFAYGFWQILNKHVDKNYIVCLQDKSFRFSKASYYGARSIYQQGEWRSSLADRIEAGELKYEDLVGNPDADIRYQLDITSMYPSVMRGIKGFDTRYPTGEARYSKDGQAEFERGVMGMFQVKYQRPEGLPIGVLPSYVNKNLTWAKEAGEGQGVYTNVDIELAQKYGYTFEFEGPCLCWDKTFSTSPFKTYVDLVFAEKAKAETPVKRTVAKAMSVVLYGKLSQKEQGSAENNRREVSAEEAMDYNDKGTNCDLVGDKWFLVNGDGSAQSQYNSKPNHLGCFILSWSRVLMMKYLEYINFETFFTHTDCLRVSASNYVKLKEAGYIGGGDGKDLGLLNIDYGLIYESIQDNTTNYHLGVLTKEGKIKPIPKGANYLNVSHCPKKKTYNAKVCRQQKSFGYGSNRSQEEAKQLAEEWRVAELAKLTS
jgi:hypothetical protein